MALMPVPLPPPTLALVKKVSLAERHPGLQLDKLIQPPERQEDQKQALEPVLKTVGDAGLLVALRERRARWLDLREAVVFRCTTTGPLAMHLSRASALENAGICLHPLYGFAYLPGTGLKGMARAYAETVWFRSQFAMDDAGTPRDDAESGKAIAAWRCIEEVFGWAPNSDDKKSWKPSGPRGIPNRDKRDREHSGDIVMHDAWPTDWPELIVDILNNHHHQYYAADAGDTDHPPGDWEDPVPVYFLAVERKATFEFALAKRREDVPDARLERAREWLLAALCHLGAGAKTNAGYGDFEPSEGKRPVVVSSRHASFETTLELATPAFLAGANQHAEDCNLRAATLRGLLRWWWRTMHAGFVDVDSLRRMEAAVWGDTGQAGAVRLTVDPLGAFQPMPYEKAARANMGPTEKVSEYGVLGADPRKTTQGLWYVSYGMDERDKRRYFLNAGCSWRLRLTARGVGPTLAPRDVLDQAKAALWLLCNFGGVGSKARKGFGSLAASDFEGWGLSECKVAAAKFRQQMKLPDDPRKSLAKSPSLAEVLTPVEVPFDWPVVWQVLDQLGFAYQAFSQEHKHRLEKKALGLPRRIGRPDPSSRFAPTGPVKKLLDAARRQGREDNVRHASPVHIHVSSKANGFLIRVLAFPAPHLPDLATSRTFLGEFLNWFAADLNRRAALPPPIATGTRRTPEPRDLAGPQPRGPTRSLPSITREDLVHRLGNVRPPQALFRVARSSVPTVYDAERLRAAPKVPAGYQGDGGYRLVNAPDGLPPGAIVLVLVEGAREGKFVETLGQLPAPPPSMQRRGHPPHGR